jgi:hypothetical protein
MARKAAIGKDTPVYLPDGKTVVGYVRSGRFHKTICGSRHFLQRPYALGFDVSTLDQAQAAGAFIVVVLDSETGKTYTASIDDIRRRGFVVQRGYGRQIALPLSAYSVSGDEPKSLVAIKAEPKHLQLGLFGSAA